MPEFFRPRTVSDLQERKTDMILEDLAEATKRLSEKVVDANPRHFDTRTLRLERGLYVIRERTSRNFSDSRAQTNEASSAVCGD
jgi:hypothetical protein